MIDNTETKRGRGRPKGMQDFVNVSMEQLQEFFGAKQAIPVRRVWLKDMNINVADSQPKIEASNRATSTPKLDIKLED
jgi:pimeloyl-CoA synthetase